MEPTKETQKITPTIQSTEAPRVSDPVVIGASALVIGYVIGSGRWQWFGQEMKKMAEGLGNLTVLYMYQSFQKKNPQLFAQKPRITH